MNSVKIAFVFLFLAIISNPLAAKAQANDTSACQIVCAWSTHFPDFKLNVPYRGINLPKGQYSLPSTAHNFLQKLGYVKRDCGEGGCTYKSDQVNPCGTPCEFPNTNGNLHPAVNLNYP